MSDIRATVNGATRLYGIIGDPVASVGSPGLFNALFAAQNANAVFVPMHVRPPDLAAALAGIRATANFDGLVVTMPHKQSVAPLLDALLPTARLVGAVNTARREADGRWVGDMFDGRGCVLGMRWQGNDPKARRVLLVGTGGAGRAIAFALAEAGAAALTLYDAAEDRARPLADAVAAAFPACAVRFGPPDPRGHDIVVNATPLGMKPGDAPPVDPARLAPGMVVVDAIVTPDPTRLCAEAAARGCRTQGGRHMLEGQAVYAARFLGFEFMPPGRPAIS